jgi:hypothetical protein
MPHPRTVDAAGNVVTHKATIENGPNVVDGRLIWTSATGITAADHNSYAGCMRRWWYDQVAELKGPPTAAMLGGTNLHSEIEDHLRKGTPLTSPLALSGRMFIPQPGGNLQIERPIHFKTKVGVDIYGHVDLYNFRQEYIDSDGVLQRDPTWSFEVKDWKTTSDFQYAKTARELADNIQLVTYSEAGFRFAPDMEHARHTHVYFRTKGRPESRLVTIRRSREEIALRWEYAESVVRSMVDVARERTAETVPGNRKSCDAYRGCPHRTRCSVYTSSSLDALYAKIATDHVQESTVGLLADSQIMTQPVTQQQLAQEEQQMRAQVAQQQAVGMQQGPSLQQIAAACAALNGYGYGFPALGGNAAQAYAAAGGQNVAPGFEYPGVMANPGARRSLHSIKLTEVAHIFQLEAELAAERGQPVAAVLPQPVHVAPGVLVQPPSPQQIEQRVMQPNPMMQPGPATFDVVKASQGENPWGKLPAQPQAGGILPPGAPESMPQLAMAQAAPPTIAGVPMAPARGENDSEPPEPKKGRGRPKKTDTGTAPEAVASPSSATQTAAAPAPTPPAPATQVTPAAAPTLPQGLMASGAALNTQAGVGCILINARFSSRPTKSLAGYVDHINAELAKRYCVTSDGRPGVQDVRCAPKDSVLAFGGWKGAVREVVKSDPPPQGDYHLDTFMDELNEVVADALRSVAEAKAWMYVRGVR